MVRRAAWSNPLDKTVLEDMCLINRRVWLGQRDSPT